MIKGGKGGSNTQTGLRFEERINLSTAIDLLDDYEVKEDERCNYRDRSISLSPLHDYGK